MMGAFSGRITHHASRIPESASSIQHPAACIPHPGGRASAIHNLKSNIRHEDEIS
jgi:hypothetical protein